MRKTIEDIRNQFRGRPRYRTALFPMVCLSGIVGIPSIIALGWGKNSEPAIPVVLYSVLGVTLGSYVYLLVRDPDRLLPKVYSPENAEAAPMREKNAG